MRDHSREQGRVGAATGAPDLVVMGLGYAGLPVAQAATTSGLRVVGLEQDASKVAALNAGASHVDDISHADVEAMLGAGFRATTDAGCLAGADAVVICVPTPLRPDGLPDLDNVRTAAATVADHLQEGLLVVLESTTYPGTTEEVVLPILEAGGMVVGRDFHLAYSPERIDPGNPHFTFRNTPKVVSGVTASCQHEAESLYGKLVDRVVPTRGTREAEMAKLLENTYRHVNIALVNEMAVFCDELGIDLWNAIAAASTKPFGFQSFHPGPGVGGHCIPIDPSYLSFKVRSLGYPFRFVELAREINNRMPAYVVARVQRMLNDHGRAVKDASILLLGVTYKPDICDDRGSPSRPVARRLLELGARVSFHDPYLRTWAVDDVTLNRCEVDAVVGEADLVLVLQPHSAYDLQDVARRSKLLFDASGRLRGRHIERL